MSICEKRRPYLKLCLLGDVGKASYSQSIVAQALVYEKCDQLFFLGDLIYPKGLKNSDDSEFKKRFYRYYKKLTQKDSFPSLHIILGNHDYLGDPNAWIEIAKKDPKIIFPHYYYLKKIDHMCFVILDTNSFLVEQAQWIKMNLAQWKYCSQLIALAHHPFISHGPNYSQASLEVSKFYKENILGKFDYLIAGHEHVVQHVGNVDGTSLFISGAGGAVAKGHRPGYMTIEKKSKDSRDIILKLKTIGYFGKISENIFQSK